MPPYGNDSDRGVGRRDPLIAGVFLILAFSTLFLSAPTQQTISRALQLTALAPFVSVQRRLELARLRGEQVDSILVRIDSLSSMLSTHSALIDENRTLRTLLGLAQRAGPSYLPATVLRPGTPGSESMFIVDVGRDDGVSDGAPIVAPYGLVGVVREARPRNAVGMDWTNPDFRVSAMLENGTAYGIVERRAGRFREEDRLILHGIPFNESVRDGTLVVTSGSGGVFPRGIPVGRIDGLAESLSEWSKSYWLTPAVEPSSATHVLVLRADVGDDVTEVWARDSIP